MFGIEENNLTKKILIEVSLEKMHSNAKKILGVGLFSLSLVSILFSALIFFSHHDLGFLDVEIFRKTREELAESENNHDRQLEADSILIVEMIQKNERAIKTKVAIVLVAIANITGFGGYWFLVWAKKGQDC